MAKLTMKFDWVCMTGKTNGILHLRSYADAQEWLTSYMRQHSLSSGVWLDARKCMSPGYRYEFVDGNDGAIWSLSENMNVQGFKCEYTGRGLPTREHSIARFLELKEQGLKPTRLDYAFDVMEAHQDVDALAKLVLDDRAMQTKSVRFMHSVSGSTIYIGSPQSDVQLRVYDKGAQVGQPEKRWVRYELQVRRAAAVAFGATPMYGFPATASKISSMLNSNGIEFDELTQTLVEDAEVPSYTPPRAPSRYYRWFWSQVLPAALSWMKDRPDEAADFMTCLNMHHALIVADMREGVYDTEADE